jgi:hypothetical protein
MLGFTATTSQTLDGLMGLQSDGTGDYDSSAFTVPNK